MKLLALSIFFSIFFIIKAQDEEKCDDYFDSCKAANPIATIECDETICTGWPEDWPEDEDTKLFDVGVCRDKCREQANTAEDPNKCKFYRWEHNAHDAKQTNCSFLSDCGGPDEYCDGAKCITGQLGCDADGNVVTACKITPKTEWTHTNFHVICTDPNHGDVNIYTEEIIDADIPVGTICSTIRMCAGWNDTDISQAYYRKLAVNCTSDGTWKAREDSGSKTESEKMITGDTTISEPECSIPCEDLKLTKYANQNWADLICDNPLADGNTLQQPNSCILLCDNHLKMTIDCKFTEDGEKLWQDGDGNFLEDDNVICNA